MKRDESVKVKGAKLPSKKRGGKARRPTGVAGRYGGKKTLIGRGMRGELAAVLSRRSVRDRKLRNAIEYVPRPLQRKKVVRGKTCTKRGKGL